MGYFKIKRAHVIGSCFSLCSQVTGHHLHELQGQAKATAAILDSRGGCGPLQLLSPLRILWVHVIAPAFPGSCAAHHCLGSHDQGLTSPGTCMDHCCYQGPYNPVPNTAPSPLGRKTGYHFCCRLGFYDLGPTSLGGRDLLLLLWRDL